MHFNNNDNLKKHQIFTPNDIAKKLLDSIGYNSNIIKKYILENSCGQGNILILIVERYLKDAQKNNWSVEEIKTGLETYIYGYDVDPLCCQICKKNLSEIATKHGIFNVKWNIYNKDFLKEYTNKNIKIKFDYIVANPPYINYTELDIQTRKYINTHFISCQKGKFDYFYPFIEASLNILSTEAKLSFIVPNSIFKNVYAEELRKILKPYINLIIDYSGLSLFNNVLTSSVIFTCHFKNNISQLEYINFKNKSTLHIDKDELSGKWLFIKKRPKSNSLKFGDLFHASISIATLFNKAFLIKSNNLISLNDQYYRLKINNKIYKIEKSSIRPCASPKSKAYNTNYFIIFPYKKLENNLYSKFKNTAEFRLAYPRTAEYLQTYKTQLLKRASDKSANWFEYGRSQALQNINQEKLLLSTIITNKVFVYNIDSETVPFSGIFITPKNNNDLNLAKKILESQKFWEYIKIIGINANGFSKRITVKDINNFIL